MTDHTEIIPLLMAEEAVPTPVQSDLGTTIVEQRNDQFSGEGYAEHGPGREQASTPDADKSWRDAFLDAVVQSRANTTKEERAELEQSLAHEEDSPEAETEEAEDGEEEAETGANPLEQFDPASVKEWAEYLGLQESDLQDPKIAQLVATQMNDAAQAEQAELQKAAQGQGQPGTPGAPPSPEEFHAYMQELDRLAQNPAINDPHMQKAFNTGLAQLLGADTPEAQQNAEQLGNMLTRAGLNLMSSCVPAIVSHMLPAALDQILPGLRSMHTDAVASNAWEEARAEHGRSLPELDSAEFNQLREEILKANPWLTSIQFKDPSGRPLHPNHPLAVRQAAAAFARLAVGQKVSPETIAKAVETGKKEAQGHARRVTASRVLGAGRSQGRFGGAQKNDFRDAITAYMRDRLSGEQE